MRYLPTSRLTPGMALGQDIYDGAGRLLLGRHILLTEEQISNLEFLGFPGVYVDDEFSQGIEIQQIAVSYTHLDVYKRQVPEPSPSAR